MYNRTLLSTWVSVAKYLYVTENRNEVFSYTSEKVQVLIAVVNTASVFLLYKWIIFLIYSYLPNPSDRAGYDTRSIFKRSLTGLNSDSSFSLTSYLTKAEEPSLSYYLPIAGRRIKGFIPFPTVLELCEMQLAWSRIFLLFLIYYMNN